MIITLYDTEVVPASVIFPMSLNKPPNFHSFTVLQISAVVKIQLCDTAPTNTKAPQNISVKLEKGGDRMNTFLLFRGEKIKDSNTQ